MGRLKERSEPFLNWLNILVNDFVDIPIARQSVGAGDLVEGRNDMDKTDKAIHELFRAVKEKDIKWNDFPSIGLGESYYCWYYAENRLYAILDVMTDEISLIEARSPIEAFGILASRLDEAMRAGQMVDEEYDESF